MRKTQSKNSLDFVALASHQLRTPLTLMKGYLAMILDGDFGNIKESSLRKALQTVYQSNENLINLVGNLLTKSRLDTRNLHLTRRTVSIEKLISLIVIELEPKARDKGLKIELIVSKHIFSFKGEAVLLRQVFFNLINNAIDYTKQGTITISLKRTKKMLIINVIDTGVGLSSRKLQILFNKFEQPYLDSSQKGFGYGLYIAGLIVKAHNGKLSAQSRKSQGLQVSCELPL